MHARSQFTVLYMYMSYDSALICESVWSIADTRTEAVMEKSTFHLRCTENSFKKW